MTTAMHGRMHIAKAATSYGTTGNAMTGAVQTVPALIKNSHRPRKSRTALDRQTLGATHIALPGRYFTAEGSMTDGAQA